ncbi:23S rRNA (adenine(1618)-N(6))-methyltransferase RlmF [Seonamhaeicola sp.]|uniref:23S rRNA (adenine(1618)-N(6))-methyltransferase RlmF n=1 Tax=Seonamhaeicola sp. TaxID=1912245 RepID=UPI00356AE4B4
MTSQLHHKNRHKFGYDFDVLCSVFPSLKPFVFFNKHKTLTIDFANPKAVKALNTSLLLAYYNVKFWEFPDENLCPPIPGRVDYIHNINDLLVETKIYEKIKVLDIGTGASCIYPILGNAEYQWDFVGTDIDKTSLKHAQHIIDKNDLFNSISLRFQENSQHILKGILTSADRFSITMCNPPFYKSEQEAIAATTRKLKGLNKSQVKLIRNFSGKHNELWYKGGEKAFLHNYIYESSLYKDQCIWFTSLVSKKELIRSLKVSLKKLNAKTVKVINMGQGNKLSRIIAWTFQE